MQFFLDLERKTDASYVFASSLWAINIKPANLIWLQLDDVTGADFENLLYAFGQSEKRWWIQCTTNKINVRIPLLAVWCCSNSIQIRRQCHHLFVRKIISSTFSFNPRFDNRFSKLGKTVDWKRDFHFKKFEPELCFPTQWAKYIF